MSDFIRKNAKALIALGVAALVNWLTPDAINQIAGEASGVVYAGVVAGLTAFVVWLTPNKAQ